MIIGIVNPFDVTERYEPLYTINTRSKGVTTADLTYNINQPNELVCVFNTNLPLDAYYAIKNGNYGIRIRQDGHDILFVQDKSSKKIDSQGQISLRFYSAIYRALYTEPSIIQKQYVNASGITTANLIEGFEFILISSDVTLNLTTGINSNLDIINELRKASGGWSYFDTGLFPRGDGTYSNRILLGVYDNIESYAGIDSRFATETLEATNIKNIFNSNPILVNIQSFYNGRQIQYLYPVLDTGQGGGSANTALVFTRTDYDFVDSQFPLVKINNKVYIQDVSYTGLEERFFVYPVTLTANSDDGAGIQIYNVEDALRYLYKKAVYYHKTQKESLRIDCEIAFRRLTFPKFLKLNYTKKIKNNGREYLAHNLNQKILYKQLKFDLAEL